MIVVRFKVQCQPGKAEPVASVLERVLRASQDVVGVVSFDIGRNLADPNSFIATEVFDDRAALDRQEGLSEVAEAMAVLETSLTEPPEATIYHVSSSEPYGD